MDKDRAVKMALASGLEFKLLGDGTMGFRPYIFKLVDMVESAVSHDYEVAAKQSIQWINVDEGLPSENSSALVRYHAHYDNEPPTEFDFSVAFYTRGEFDVKDQYFYQKRKVKVTHWLALPKLPKRD